MTATRADIIRAMAAEPWALDRRVLESLAVTATIDDLRAAAAARSNATASLGTKHVAVIPIFGPITRRSSWLSDLFGGTSIEGLRISLGHALADKGVGRIVLLVDSPGGTVGGTPELATAIRGARTRKPIIAVVEGMAASAAYWLASQATAIVAGPSSDLGSIGVYSLHSDITGALDKAGIVPTFIAAPGPEKIEMSGLVKLTDPARAYEQAQIDRIYFDFVGDVALGRRVARSVVRESFGGGRMIGARQAVSLGMADQLGTLDDVLDRGSHDFESESRAVAGMRSPTYAMERASRRLRTTERIRAR